MSSLDRWLQATALRLDPETLDPVPEHAEAVGALVDRLAKADVVVLGEANHFVHEKAAFRLWWLERLAARRPLVLAEELSLCDGRHVAAFLADGDHRHLERCTTFGATGHERTDRDDRPTGILRASADAYPTALFATEQRRFYEGVRERVGPARFHGIDIDVAGVGAPALVTAGLDPATEGLAPVPGESVEQEAARFTALAARLGPLTPEVEAILDATVSTLRYAALAHPAPTYEALSPALALRERLLHRQADRLLAGLRGDELLVVMAHSFHVAKHDAGIAGRAPASGPGGGRVRSLGHHLAQETGAHVASAWMAYGGGADSQPFPDLPQEARYPGSSLNRRLARLAGPLVVPVLAGEVPEGSVGYGHLYSGVDKVDLAAVTDALWFLPEVGPLRP